MKAQLIDFVMWELAGADGGGRRVPVRGDGPDRLDAQGLTLDLYAHAQHKVTS